MIYGNGSTRTSQYTKSVAREGVRHCDDRNCLDGIIFILRSGTQWQMLPSKQFGVSGSTCWRRFADWSKRGVWSAVQEDLLNELGLAGKIDLSSAVIDSASVRAVVGGATPGQIQRIARQMAANVTSLAVLMPR